ncbi:hypothetical protein ORI89_14110 [Sphingobacterium sp. UT-1RO-CII-1]|uniref:hypothetical protein n=1 Tax=Sphingobacterium sp. UT-1RO-CII-1 TaxID=2995225 RepID=UPI00227BE63D|nr:hypothetical protein [Sphingobacterium sp. UT-1RO-CII-1]MCY4780789.1 hypothetical protein [Sphingobacterium sp. UT-1RO-CII-1]
MAKVTNIVLAEKITTRINDILEKTNFTLLGLAIFSGVGRSAIKSYHSKTIPISVETVNKICAPLSIDLVSFFDFKSEIILTDRTLDDINNFKEANKENVSDYFVQENSNLPPTLKDSKSKWEIKMIDYIIHRTSFFKTNKTTAEIQQHLSATYSMDLKPDRIYNLLLKHIGVSLKQGKTNRINQDGSISTQMIATYIRM